MSTPVLVSGASGFIGSRLCAALTAEGYAVRAMTRNPGRYDGAGAPVFGDVADEGSLREALNGTRAAYYLVHALGSDDFEDRDADAAVTFGGAAADAGVDRVIYLGGLGVDDGRLSPHLASRRQVEQLLPLAGVPVTVLRAAVVIGHGGISWELTRQLVDHLPAMVTPRWVHTRTQPIALPDVIRYLVGVLEPPQARGRTFEIGGPEVLSYLEMMRRAADIMGKRLRNVSVPLLTPGLSSRWLSLVTDVDTATARTLVESMVNEVVVTDHSIYEIVPGPAMGYDDAVRLALADHRRSRAGAAAAAT
ncbi:MAG TPA: NAD(P)H-binding protein [Kineosporiaceae bacterium]